MSTCEVSRAMRQPWEEHFRQFMASHHPEIQPDDLRWQWFHDAYWAGRDGLTDAIIHNLSQEHLQTGNEAQKENQNQN